MLLAVTPAMGTKKGTLALTPLPKIDELFALLKGAKYLTALDLHSGYYHIKLDDGIDPQKVLPLQCVDRFKFPWLPFGLSQGPDFFTLDHLWSFSTGQDMSTQDAKAQDI